MDSRHVAAARVSQCFALVTLLLGALVLLGWGIGNDRLTQVFPRLSAMNPMTATSFVLAGLVLLAQTGIHRALRYAGAGIIIGIGAAKLGELFLHLPFAVDQVLFAGELGRAKDVPPNRMAPNTAIALCFTGAALLLSNSRRPPMQLIAQVLALLTASVALFAIIGYLLDVTALYLVSTFNPMALHSAVGLLALSVATISTNPQSGVMRILSDRGPAGSLAKTVLPFALLFPVALGVLRLMGEGMGLYGAKDGAALQVFANILVTLGLLMTSIIVLYRSDLQRREREHAVALSEQRYRIAEKIGRVGHWGMKLATRDVTLSDEFKAMCGLPPEARPTLDETLALFHPDDAAESRAAISAALLEKRDWGGAQRLVRADGEMRHIRSHGVCELAPTGEVDALFGVVVDVTELEKARHAAEAASRAQSEFVANVSHELRTPLTAVIGFSELLRDQPELSDISRRFTTRVSNAGKALLAAVNDILDYSKLEAGEVEFSRKPEVPDKVIADALEIFSLQAADRSIILAVDGADTLPERLSLDASRLRQILLNLIGNAVKFTQEGEVRVRCSYDKASEVLSVAISDTGPGISPEAQEKLFRRFSQVDGTSSGGTGLGLAICKALVEAMGGWITIDSRLGEGATFSFAVPAPMVAAAADETTLTDQGASLAGLRILVTDDQVANREVVAGFLSPYGVELCEASDGQEAVELAAIHPFDVILMDLRMPIMGGPEAARRIANVQGPNDRTPVLSFSSSMPDPSDASLFVGSVQKPVTSTKLVDAILLAVDGL